MEGSDMSFSPKKISFLLVSIALASAGFVNAESHPISDAIASVKSVFQDAKTTTISTVEDAKTQINDKLERFKIAQAYYLDTAKQDAKVAYELLLASANEGVAQAQFYVSELLEEGRGVTKDTEQAFKWLQTAAENGLEDAEYKLGQMYLSVKKDTEKALYWLQRAADKGNKKAADALEVLKASLPK